MRQNTLRRRSLLEMKSTLFEAIRFQADSIYRALSQYNRLDVFGVITLKYCKFIKFDTAKRTPFSVLRGLVHC